MQKQHLCLIYVTSYICKTLKMYKGLLPQLFVNHIKLDIQNVNCTALIKLTCVLRVSILTWISSWKILKFTYCKRKFHALNLPVGTDD